MAWLSKKIQDLKNQAAERRNANEHAHAVARTQNQIHNFWNQVLENIGNRPESCQLPENLPHQLKAFLATLEVPLEQYPRAAEIGLPMLQLYFFSMRNPQVEHSLLAVALEAGLPVTPQLCEFFAQSCVMAPVGHVRSCGLEVPHRFLKRCEYPNPKQVSSFAAAVQYRVLKDPTWTHSEKYAQGAKLLEAFGADWRTQNSEGVPLGQQLHACLNEQQRTAFEKYVRTTPLIDVAAIVDKRKAEQQSRVAKIKI